MITVELHGLEVFGRHGVGEEERGRGRTFLFDVDWDVEEPAEDDVGETLDYRDVAGCVRDVSDARQFRLIETLGAAVADALAERFALRRVRVRVRKPGLLPAGLRVAHSAATVERVRR